MKVLRERGTCVDSEAMRAQNTMPVTPTVTITWGSTHDYKNSTLRLVTENYVAWMLLLVSSAHAESHGDEN